MGFNFDIYDLDSYNEPLSKEPISEKNNENSSPIFSNKKDKANFDFDVYDSESNPVIGQSGEKPEGFLKNTARTLLQIPQGVLEATTYGITTGLGALLGQGEISDPEEIERIRQASERAGKPFDEEAYLQAGQKALGAYPTISNIGRKIEEKTGIPLEPKTRFQKFLRFGSTAGKAIPKPSQAAPKGYGFRGTNTGLPRPILGAGVSSISQLLQEFGIPEPFADILSFGSVKPIEATGSRLNIGKERGESGLVKRRYENLNEPIEVSPQKLNKINTKVEKEFRNISDKIIAESPIAEVNNSLKTDIGYKQKVLDQFENVKDLAADIPNTFPIKSLKSELETVAKKKISSGLTPSEFDKARKNFIDQFIKETPEKDFTASDIVEQYRKNNRQLSEVYEPGQSFAYNRAKREALLDYNSVLAEMIEREFPNSEFSNLFKETNKQWADIANTEAVTNFVDEIFKGNINFKTAKDLFRKEGKNVPFKKALGEKGFEDFKTLLNDLVPKENGYKLIKAAQNQGYADLAKTGAAYLIHPHAGQAKLAYQFITGGYKSLMRALLDKPQLAITWDRGVNAFKKGDFKAAQQEFNRLTKEVNTAEKTRIDNLKKFNEKIKKPINQSKNSQQPNNPQ